MQILPFFRGALVFTSVSLLFAASFCYGDGNTVEVAGMGECADCAGSNIKTSQAFSGLHVTIDCKPENGEFERRGAGELDEEGKFKVTLPGDIVEDGKLKEECYAQLHSASATPCPAHNGLESSKIVFKTKSSEKHTFGLAGKLKFSPVTCTSANLWPYFKYPPLPPLPEFPPFKSFHHPCLCHPKPKPPFMEPEPPVPIYKPKPKPPMVKPKPPVPSYKPKPKPPIMEPKPPAPIYKPKPKPPIVDPKPPVPIYKPKPKPPVTEPKPPVPIYKPKPKPPIMEPKPPVPIYKPMPKPFYKPFPHIPMLPPFQKPCPPLPKLPPKMFHHPKFGKWPHLPSLPPMPPMPPLPPLSPMH